MKRGVTRLVLFLFVLTIASNSRLSHEFLIGQEKNLVADLASLPVPFSNEKLPPSNLPKVDPSQQTCSPMIGCFEAIPITYIGPKSVKTTFYFYGNNRNEEVVQFKPTKYCYVNSTDDCQEVPFNLNKLLQSGFDPETRTIVIINGYLSQSKSDWELNIKNLWLNLDDVNVIIVGWNNGNTGLYEMASVNTRTVARHLTVLFYYLAQLFNKTLEDETFTSNVYIIGHSLGAHIAGFVGQDLGGRLGRITGLDTAGPYFDNLATRFKLDKTDAQLVDALHTNAGTTQLTHWGQQEYGSVLANAHVDLYPNGGKHQPGCNNDLTGCSHSKAHEYYAAFLRHQLTMRSKLSTDDSSLYRLRAYRGDSFDDFRLGISLVESCPNTVVSNDDFYSPDLDICSIAIDYVTKFDLVKRELETKNGIDFSSSNNLNESKSNKYYFYTNKFYDDQNDHYLLKIQMKRSVASSMHESGIEFVPIGCDFQVSIEMDRSRVYEDSFEAYMPLSTLDNYVIFVPYLSPALETKIQLADLDSDDFHLGAGEETNKSHLERLSADLRRLFPISIKIHGLGQSVLEQFRALRQDSQQDSQGWFSKGVSKVKGWWSSTNDNQQDRQASLIKLDPRCVAPIGDVSIVPLRKMHRHLLASYTQHGLMQPDLVIMQQDAISLETNVAKRYSKTSISSTSWNSATDRYLQSVIIGPHDSSIDPPKKEQEPEFCNEPDDEDEVISIRHKQKSPETTPPDTTTGGSSIMIWSIILLINFLVLVTILVSILKLTKHPLLLRFIKSREYKEKLTRCHDDDLRLSRIGHHGAQTNGENAA